MNARLLGTLICCCVISFKISAQTIKGIDVSDYQGTVNWVSVKGDGITYAYAKATEGLTITDSQFANYIPNGEAAGLYMGAYHFAHPDNHPTLQGAIDEANHFLSVAQSSIQTCQLPPALDYETDVSATLSYSFQAQWIQTWCNTVQSATGILPIIYSGGSIAQNLGTYLSSQYKLWYPYYYNSRSDASPPPTTYYGTWGSYKIWQYSDQGTVAGISGSVDMDDFNGTLTDLRNLMACTAPVCHTYYASVPYTTSFETAWITDSCSWNAERLPDVYWKSSIGGTTPNGNDYLHREDYSGSDWTSLTTGAYTPAASNGNHSARFHNDPPPAGSTGSLDLYINLSGAGSKTISFDYIHDESSPSPFSFDVLLSTDGGVTFPTTLHTITTSSVGAWATQSFNTSATSATSVVRFRVTDKGTNDVGIDNLKVSLSIATDITAVNENTDIEIFPNPNDGILLNGRIPNYTSNTIDIAIFDILGKEVLNKTVNLDGNNFSLNLEENKLSAGTYFFIGACAGKQFRKKIVIN